MEASGLLQRDSLLDYSHSLISVDYLVESIKLKKESLQAKVDFDQKCSDRHERDKKSATDELIRQEKSCIEEKIRCEKLAHDEKLRLEKIAQDEKLRLERVALDERMRLEQLAKDAADVQRQFMMDMIRLFSEKKGDK